MTSYTNIVNPIKRLIRQWIPRREPIISPEQDAFWRSLVGDIDRHLAGVETRVKLLYVPGYYMISYLRLFDCFMSLALRLRGAEIIPVLFPPSISQQIYFGGLYAPEGDQSRGREMAYLENKIWRETLRTEAINLDDFSRAEDEKLAVELAEGVTFENHRDLIYKGFRAGLEAAKITANLNNLPNIIDNNKLMEQLRTHIRNIVVLINAYERIFDRIKPDTIFSNVPSYYKWGAAYHVAQNKKIPFYSSMLGERKNTFLFTSDTDKLFDVTPAWPSFMSQEFSEDTWEMVEEVIQLRRQRQTDTFSPYPASGQYTRDHERLFGWLDRSKPLVLFPVNVLYDVAVYQESPVFNNPLEMLDEIISFFNKHQEYQLILKAHPAEKLMYDSDSEILKRSCLRNLLKELPQEIGSNIVFLDYDTQISIFDLIPLVSMGIVFSSSSAMEMAWTGKPLLSVARTHYSNKGFTYEPKDQQEFYQLMVKILSEGEPEHLIKRRIELSKKYYWLYYYHGRVDFKLFEGCDVGEVPTRPLFNSFEALLPGKSAALDYICDAIINRLPIYGENRWPPLTL